MSFNMTNKENEELKKQEKVASESHVTSPNSGSLDKALDELDKIVKVFGSKDFPKKIAKIYIKGAGKPMGKWSFGNQMLVLLGNSEDARGFKQWGSVGRHVIKGRKAIRILAPKMVMIDEKDKITKKKTGKKFPVCVGFNAIPVFRYEDTEGTPLKEYKPKQLPPLIGVAEKWGVKVRYDDTSIMGENGSYSPSNKEIRLCVEEMDTFFHELAHLAHMKIDGKLKMGQDPEQEAIAQLTACVLSKMYGYDAMTYTFNYISSYSKSIEGEGGNRPLKVGKMCFKVMKKVQQILECILDQKELNEDKKSMINNQKEVNVK